MGKEKDGVHKCPLVTSTAPPNTVITGFGVCPPHYGPAELFLRGASSTGKKNKLALYHHLLKKKTSVVLPNCQDQTVSKQKSTTENAQAGTIH